MTRRGLTEKVLTNAMQKRDNNSVSLAGEFAVLSQLVLNGYDANKTLGRTKGVDILVSHHETMKMYKLEVKTKYRTSRKKLSISKVYGKVLGQWIMDKKHESLVDPPLFYCFVMICEPTSSFEFYIVPSRVVARYVAEQHKYCLRKKRKEGKKVADTRMRAFRMGFKGHKYGVVTPVSETYQNNWEFRES